jgi:glycosyltransferase involved in cell wall biosynthesis
MRILFIHQNFPGQYKHLAPALAARPGNEVVALAMNDNPSPPGVRSLRYKVAATSATAIHPWASDFETKVIRGEAVARACRQLKDKGFVPDIICGHHGWGEILFVKDVFPDAPLLAFIEFFYQAHGSDHDFDPEYASGDWQSACRIRAKNAAHLMSLEACDWAVTPTEWQRSTIPATYQAKVSVIHDGIDTGIVRADPAVSIALKSAGVTLTARDDVITFVNRNLEPYRGFHVFMRALPEIQRRRPNAWVLIVGGEDVSYGARLPDGQTYRQKAMAEVGASLNMERVRFLGRVPYADFVRLLQISGVHVYLTYPFVLSWSMLEAMAAECLVVGSATPPVEEVIRDGDNGLLVDFFSKTGLADAIDRVLDHPDRMRALRMRARQTVIDGYDLKSVCLPRQLALVDDVAALRLPPPATADDRAAVARASLQRALAAKQARPAQRVPRRRR